MLASGLAGIQTMDPSNSFASVIVRRGSAAALPRVKPIAL
jgi:hypothetical protein